MSGAGETDLDLILRALEVRRRDGVFVFVSIPPGAPLPDVALSAMVSEVDGTTLVISRDDADALGLGYHGTFAWLSVVVHTSLSAVGVTATLSTALAMRGISCNMIAGAHHDHMLVPVDRVDEAIDIVGLVRQQRLDDVG